jgi:hypothetical protein
VDARLSESIAAFVGEDVLIAIPVNVACADQALELFWRQLLACNLPLQLSDDLVHAVPLHDERARHRSHVLRAPQQQMTPFEVTNFSMGLTRASCRPGKVE